MMPDFSKRSAAVEIMDDLNCSGEVVNQTLRELDFINHWLGGNKITISGLNKLTNHINSIKPDVLKIIDLGCGSGEMLLLIRNWARKKNIKTELVGIDANPNIIDYARKGHEHDSAIEFDAVDIFSEAFAKKEFDVAIATLFFHHFTHDQLVSFLSQLKSQARLGIVINDLHRNPFAYYSIKWLTQFFSKSAMVKFDAPLSVLRGFSKGDLMEIFKRAGIINYILNWRWAFRWQAVIYSSKDGHGQSLA